MNQMAISNSNTLDTSNQIYLSVIVPVYKVEAYIKHCLDSLLNQNFQNVEFILVDDGSPDSCGSICDHYSDMDSRFKSFHKENGGLSSARNFGIDKAQGDYLMFVDSDDWVSPDFCSTAYNLAKEKSADLVMFYLQFIQNENEIQLTHTKEKEGYKSWKEGIDLLLGRIGVFACNKLYKRTLFNGIRFPDGRQFEDQPVTWQLVYKATKIYCSNDILYYYRMRKDSIIHQVTKKTLKDRFEMKEMLYDGLTKVGYSSELLDSSLSQAAMAYAMYIKESADDQTGIRVHKILRELKNPPKCFSWKQKILMFFYSKRLMIPFNACCIVYRKRLVD